MMGSVLFCDSLKFSLKLCAVFAVFCVVTVHGSGMLKHQDSEVRTSVSMNGIWKFKIDDSPSRNRGFEQKWYQRPLENTGPVILMPVPSSYNDITQNKTIRDFVGWAWYETDVFVPFLWQNQRIVLRFDSVHYFAAVWVNGQHAISHEGGHLPFEANVNDFVRIGSSNRITVAVNNTLSPTSLPPGEIQYKDDTNKYPPGYFTQWYQFDFLNYAGIHRNVFLYTTPHCYIDDVTIKTNYTGQVGHVFYSTSTVGQCSRPTWLVEIVDARNFVVSRGVQQNARLEIPRVNLWWPVFMSTTPGYQYTLRITMKSNQDGKVSMDVYRQKFGVRTIGFTNKQIFINSKPFYCQGFGKHEDADIRGKGLDIPILVKDFNLIQWVGANCVRTSHYPYSEEFMDLADSQGIMIIDECPGVGIKKVEFYGPQSLSHHKEVMMELVRRDKNRPAVFMWSVANEPSSSMQQSRSYFQQVIQHTRSLDATRMVTFVIGGSNFKNDQVSDFVDVVCVNHYYGWYSDTGDTSIIRRQLTYDLNSWHQKFQKPVILTEYGADTIAGFHQDPSFVFTEEFQVDYIREYHAAFDVMKKDFLVGEMIWQFADFMTKQGVTRVLGNRKGIFTRQRQPKMAAHVMRMRYVNLARNQTKAEEHHWPCMDFREEKGHLPDEL